MSSRNGTIMGTRKINRTVRFFLQGYWQQFKNNEGGRVVRETTTTEIKTLNNFPFPLYCLFGVIKTVISESSP